MNSDHTVQSNKRKLTFENKQVKTHLIFMHTEGEELRRVKWKEYLLILRALKIKCHQIIKKQLNYLNKIQSFLVPKRYSANQTVRQKNPPTLKNKYFLTGIVAPHAFMFYWLFNGRNNSLSFHIKLAFNKYSKSRISSPSCCP